MRPTVTVAITTYNSESYVLETLASIKDQTYPKLALIVSDDASKDNTLEKVNNWLSLGNNKERFEKIQVITVPENTGVSANCNRCIYI